MSSLNPGYFFTVVPSRAVVDKNLTHAEYRVFSVLCTYINDKTTQCWPSYNSISERCNISKRNVMDHIKNLENKGYITIKKRNSKTKGLQSNIYTIIFDTGERLSEDEIPIEEDENDSDDFPYPSDTHHHYPSVDIVPPSDSHHHQGSDAHHHQGSDAHHHPNKTNITIPKEERIREVNRDAIHSPQTPNINSLLIRWNELASNCGLKKILKLTPQRKSTLLARFRDLDESIDNWGRFLQKISQTPFLLGQNDRGWQLTFDKAINQSMFLKILEGNYDFKSRSQSKMNELAKLLNDDDEEEINTNPS